MKTTLRIGTALLAIGALAPAAGAQGAGAKCKPREGERVVVRSKVAVVTRAKGQNGPVLHGCLIARGRRYRLFRQDPGYPYEVDSVARVRLAGRYAALQVDRSQKGDVTTTVRVFDLRNGHSGAVTAGNDYRASGGDEFTIERLVLSRRGAVAWRAKHTYRSAGTGEPSQQVAVADSHGLRVLDSAAPGTLGGPVFAGASRVAWSHDGGDDRSARAYAGLPRD